MFLLCVLYCCLGFSGACFFAVWAGRVLCFAVWAGAGAPPKQRKHEHAPTLPSVSFFAVWAAFFCCLGGVRVFFYAVWAGGVFFLLFGRGRASFFAVLFGRGACLFFLLFGRGRAFFLLFGRRACFVFAVWAGDFFFFLLFGRGTCFFAVWAGDGSSLTYRSAWLVFKGPNTKKDQTAQKKKTRVPR